MSQSPKTSISTSKSNIKGKFYVAITLGLFVLPIVATFITQNIGYLAFVFGGLMVFGGIFGKGGKDIGNEMQMDIIRILFICVGSGMVIFALFQFGCPYVEHLASCNGFPIKS